MKLKLEILLRMLNNSEPLKLVRQLYILCYRRNYILILVGVLTSFHARSQSEENLLRLINTESIELHDSLYYELVKANYRTDVKKAKHYAELSLNLSSKYKHLSAQSKACRALGYLYVKTNQLDSASIYYYTAIRISTAHNFTGRLIELYNDVGLLYDRLDVCDSSLHYFIMSYNLSIKNQSYEDQAIASGNIGLAFTYLKNYAKAIFYFKKAIAIKRKNGIQDGLNLDYINLARIFNEQDRYKDAIEQLKKVELNCKSGCDDNTLSGLNYSLGYANLKKGYNNKSYSFFVKALNLAKKCNDKQWLANTLYQLSFFSIANTNYGEAINYLKEAEAIATSITHRRLLRDVYNQLSIVYTQTGALDKAMHYKTLYVQVKDSIFNQQVANNVNTIQLREQGREANAVLGQKENALSISYIFMAMLGIIAMLMLTLAFFVSRALASSRKHRQAMELHVTQMLDYRTLTEKELFRSHMEFTSLLTRITGFLNSPVTFITTLANTIKKAPTGSESITAANTLALVCNDILVVLKNMDDLLLYKNHSLVTGEVDMAALAGAVRRDFKKLKNFIGLTITVEPAAERAIQSDHKLIRVAIQHAINYFHHASENPVVEVLFSRPPNDDAFLRVAVKHHSQANRSLPYRSHFNYLSVMVATAKLGGDFQVIQAEDYTLFEIFIPVNPGQGNKTATENISHGEHD